MALTKMLFFVLFIVSIVFISGCNKNNETLLGNPCVLMQDKNTGETDCFGCANKLCKDPSFEFEQIDGGNEKCIVTKNGCELRK